MLELPIVASVTLAFQADCRPLSALRLVLGMVLLASVGGCLRAGYEDLADSGDGPARPNRPTDLDLSDLNRDVGVPVDGVPPDSVSPDAAPLPDLTCAQPTLISSGSVNLVEPGLETNGLRLWARDRETGGSHYTDRPSPGAPFGAWKKHTMLDGKQDPAFFRFLGGEYVMLAVAGPSVRSLELCDLTNYPSLSCGSVSLLDQSGASISHLDVDGPAVVALTSTAMMLVDVETAPGQADVFIATPESPGALDSWRVTPVAQLAQASVWEDDPTISPDGDTIVFASDVNNGDLWVTHRGPSGGWSAPEPAAGVNTPHSEGGPVFGLASGSSIELFFASNRGGPTKIYRAGCQLQ